MIGLVIVTHGDFGAALLRATEFIVGPLVQAAVVSIDVDDDMKVRRRDIATAIQSTDSGDGVMVVTDLFGGTPSNLAISLMTPKVEVVAGANLPMLIRFNGARRQRSLAECAESVRNAGRKYISIASEILAPPPDDAEKPAATPDDEQKNQTSDALQHLAEELTELKRLLSSFPRRHMAHGQIGHNLPLAGFTAEDEVVLEEGETAARVAADEVATDQPSRDILKLCVSALKRVLKLLKEIALWALSKGDLFVGEAAKSAGKAVGPAIVVSAAVAQLTGQLSELIDRLRSLAGL